MAKKIDDDFLYKYMSQAEEKWIEAIENTQQEPHIYTKKFQRELKKIIRDSQKSKTIRKQMTYLRRIAAVIAITLTILFAGCMSSEAARTKLFEIIKKIYEDCTEYIYDTGTGESMDQEFLFIEPSYLPEGYSESGRIEEIGVVIYQKESEGEETKIECYESLADGLAVLLDTEGAKIVEGEISGTKVEYFTNKGTSYLYWTDEDTYYNIMGNINMEEIIKMGKSIIDSEEYQNKNK
jgi:hypothetical protein